MRLSLFRFFIVTSLVLAYCTFSFADGMEPGVPVHKSTSTKSTKPHSAHSHKAPVRKAGKNTNTKPLSDFELLKYQYCGEDSDCTVAVNGCCDCANGGIEVAVNKERLEDFQARFACLHVQCGTKPADPLCKNGVVSCVSHRCIYHDDRSTQEF